DSRVAQLGRHPRGPIGPVELGRDRRSLRGQRSIRRHALGPTTGAITPLVVRGPADLQDLTQPLHPEGGRELSDELETAAHQVVSPVKYFAALRRISRSVSSSVLSARNRLFSAR